MHMYKYEINLKKETIRCKEESKITKILISEGNSKQKVPNQMAEIKTSNTNV